MWERLADRYDVSVLLTSRNAYEVGDLRIGRTRSSSLRSLLPPGRVGDLALGLPGDRYLGAASTSRVPTSCTPPSLATGTLQAARRKPKLGFRLALTVWETIPFAATRTGTSARAPTGERALEAADLFLPTTERARDCLLLEGVPADRLSVCYPGIDTDRFARRAAAAADEHVILSPGRLVWEKGHQDVIRALAALRRGIVPRRTAPRLLIVGSGPEEERLRRTPTSWGSATASSSGRRALRRDAGAVTPGRPASRWPASRPACADPLPPGAGRSSSGWCWPRRSRRGRRSSPAAPGAIPEVAGPTAHYFSPGDWKGWPRRSPPAP